jgi:hypothetical protein
MAKYLTKQAILEAQDLQTEPVEVPEWGGAVLVRSLTGRERDAYEQSVMVRRGRTYEARLTDARAKLVSLSIVDEEGVRMFSDGDVKKLTQKSAAALSRVFNMAARLSGISEADLDELAKNSGSAQNGASGSD